jgi:hypothetical protein
MLASELVLLHGARVDRPGRVERVEANIPARSSGFELCKVRRNPAGSWTMTNKLRTPKRTDATLGARRRRWEISADSTGETQTLLNRALRGG